MKSEQFNKIVEGAIARVSGTLISKRKEYSDDEDVFRNFKNAARIDNITSEQALWGMMLKHYTSLNDIKNKINKGEYPNIELFREKQIDLINYMILLEGLIEEYYEKDSFEQVK